MHKLKRVLILALNYILIYAAVNVVPLVLIYFGTGVFYLLSELSLKNIPSIPEFLENMKILIALTASMGMIATIGIKCAHEELKGERRTVERVKVE